MKKTLILLFSIITMLGSAQDILWEKSFGGKHADFLMDAVATPDYGFLLAGSSLSGKSGNKTALGNGDLDYWLWKMKENGDLDWQKSFGGTGNDFLHCVKLTNDGGYILGGTSNSTDVIDEVVQSGTKTEKCRGGDDFWIIKLNAAGNEEWQKTIGGMGQEKLKSIAQTKDGGYIVGGSSASPSPSKGEEQDPTEAALYGEKKSENFGNMDYWVVKLDKNGKIVWQKTFGGIYEDELRSIEATNDGGYIVGGYSNSPQSGNKTDDNKGTGDYWVIKLDQTGTITWQKTVGGSQDDQLYVVHQTYDGNYILGGNSNSEASNEKRSNNSNGTDFWVLKLGQEGEILWQENYDIAEVDILSSIVENKDHTLLIGGSPLTPKGGIKNGSSDFVAIKIKENGEEIWRRTLGSDGEDLCKKVIETRDGGYLLAGTSLPPAPSEGGGVGTLQKTGGDSSFRQNDKLGIKQTQNQQLQKTTNEVNQTIADTQKEVNNAVNGKMKSATDAINNALPNNNDSAIKYGLNAPTGMINLPNLGSVGSAGNSGSAGMPDTGNQGLRGTGNQTKIYGSSDFWVVKLRDKDKKEVIKATIEALPNPAVTFTNIIVGYEFTSGTAMVADLAGRQLQSFAITSRTVPVDLTDLPEGIYIINISTNVQSDGIKVIKKGNKD